MGTPRPLCVVSDSRLPASSPQAHKPGKKTARGGAGICRGGAGRAARACVPVPGAHHGLLLLVGAPRSTAALESPLPFALALGLPGTLYKNEEEANVSRVQHEKGHHPMTPCAAPVTFRLHRHRTDLTSFSLPSACPCPFPVGAGTGFPGSSAPPEPSHPERILGRPCRGRCGRGLL